MQLFTDILVVNSIFLNMSINRLETLAKVWNIITDSGSDVIEDSDVLHHRILR